MIGIDSQNGDGGMGTPYVRACQLMHLRQRLGVDYSGFVRWIEWLPPTVEWQFAVFNFRGSFEQCWAEYMDGDHSEHHDCKKLAWQWTAALRERLRSALAKMKERLVSSGVVMIAANGSANDDEYEREMLSAAFDVGLNVDLRKSPKTLRLLKP